jgi:hypothetical protein
MEARLKKTEVIARLLVSVFDEIKSIQILLPDDEYPRLSIIFHKNPALEFNTYFALTDTWDRIKNKVKKMAESDGLCVVCFEPQKSACPPFCPTCCEITCFDCIKTSGKMNCPVCRSCLNVDIHTLEKKECNC